MKRKCLTEGLLIKILSIVRMLFGMMFAVSGFMKLMQPYQNFLSVIHSYEILGASQAAWLARTLPWAEYLLGVFLVLGLWSRPVILALWGMNTVFIGVLASALIRKLPIHECGCFGESLALPPHWMLVLDILFWFIFMAFAGFFQHTRAYSLDKKFDR